MACIEDGIDHIIIVDNGSPLENKIKLCDFANSHKKNIEIVRNEENLGSAGGYARGIKKPYQMLNMNISCFLMTTI